MKTITILILFISISPLWSSETQRVAICDLSDQHNEKIVEVRGFVYQANDGKVVLSPQPNLRSCCVGSSKKLHEQVILYDLKTSPKSTQAVSIQGTFHLNPDTEIKSLTQSELIITRKNYHLTFLAIVSTLIFTFLLIRRRS